MPELPEVESIRRELFDKVVNKKVVSVEVYRSNFIRSGLLSAAVGHEIIDLRRRGKYIIIDTDSELKLYIHLRMTGIILWQKLDEKVHEYVRAEIKLKNGKLSFKDVRALGGIWVSSDGNPPWGKMGVEALSDNLNTGYLKKACSKRKSSIKNLLLDQGIIAGIGNIYASEVLFKSKIHPLVAANSLSTKEIDNIIKFTKETLTASINSAGTTFRDFKLSDGKKGGFKEFLNVYGKKNEPCTKCSTIIETVVIAQRSTFYCPNCQKSHQSVKT